MSSPPAVSGFSTNTSSSQAGVDTPASSALHGKEKSPRKPAVKKDSLPSSEKAQAFAKPFRASMSQQKPFSGRPQSSPSNSLSIGGVNASVWSSNSGHKILLVSQIKGRLSVLNELAARSGADCILHTGDFGFFDRESYVKSSDSEIRSAFFVHAQNNYLLLNPSTLSALGFNSRNRGGNVVGNCNFAKFKAHLPKVEPKLLRSLLEEKCVFSELPDFIAGKKQFKVPVYTISGSVEDIKVLEKFRKNIYQIPNLIIVDETRSHLLSLPTTTTGNGSSSKIRIYGLGGSIHHHLLFDHGEGAQSIAGNCGKIWASMLQIGSLVETFRESAHLEEIKIFLACTSPAREPLIGQLSCLLNADFVGCCYPRSQYGVVYSDFCVQDVNTLCNTYQNNSKEIISIWDQVKFQVEKICTQEEKRLFHEALSLLKVFPSDNEAFKKMLFISPADVSLNFSFAFSPDTFDHNPGSSFSLPLSFALLVDNFRTRRLHFEMHSVGKEFGRQPRPLLNSSRTPSVGVHHTDKPRTFSTTADSSVLPDEKSSHSSNEEKVKQLKASINQESPTQALNDSKNPRSGISRYVVIKGLLSPNSAPLTLTEELKSHLKSFLQNCGIKSITQTPQQSTKGMVVVSVEDEDSYKSALSRNDQSFDLTSNPIVVEPFRSFHPQPGNFRNHRKPHEGKSSHKGQPVRS
eukprot:Sdes_comp15890_c0_seq2m5006